MNDYLKLCCILTTTNLKGRIALITGARIKIGFETALRLLQDGATVIVTTRFPQDAAKRFLAQADSHEWRNRLTLEALDLRHIPSVEAFAERLCQTLPHLDILINHAAQTVKRPIEFYSNLIASEPTPWLLETQKGYSQQLLDYKEYFSSDECDRYGQLIDKRPHHSWTAKFDEISTLELLETQLVNSIAPFVLTARLKPAFVRSPFSRRFVIQVSAVEGQFSRENRNECHPHTNMAKAALNMLVRTSAPDWARDKIYMNAVDTGWVSNENPHPKAQQMQQNQQFYPPLDFIDATARLLDPIYQGLNENNEPLLGHYLKDYESCVW